MSKALTINKGELVSLANGRLVAGIDELFCSDIVDAAHLAAIERRPFLFNGVTMTIDRIASFEGMTLVYGDQTEADRIERLPHDT